MIDATRNLNFLVDIFTLYVSSSLYCSSNRPKSIISKIVNWFLLPWLLCSIIVPHIIIIASRWYQKRKTMSQIFRINLWIATVLFTSILIENYDSRQFLLCLTGFFLFFIYNHADSRFLLVNYKKKLMRKYLSNFHFITWKIVWRGIFVIISINERNRSHGNNRSLYFKKKEETWLIILGNSCIVGSFNWKSLFESSLIFFFIFFKPPTFWIVTSYISFYNSVNIR